MFQTTKWQAKSVFLNTGMFRKVYVITLFFEMIAFFDVVSLGVRCFVLAWGFIIIMNNFLINKKAFKIKHSFLLWGFISVGIVTSILHLSRSFPENLVFVYHSIVCFFIFYGMYIENPYYKLEKELVFLFKFFIVFSTFFSVLSIFILIFKAQVNISSYYLGIFRSRLIGVYTNPNLLAFSSVVSIVSSDILNDKYITKRYKMDKFPMWVLMMCMGINFISLFLSDSNASIVFVVIYFTVKMFYKNFSSYSYIGIPQLTREGISLVVFCFTMVAGSFIIRNASQDIISLLVNDVHKIEEPITDDSPELLPNKSHVNTYMHDEISIGRENYDISSGRIILFKQGLELFKISPFIGIGRGNLVLYGEKYLEGGLVFSELHNGYLTILVSYGIIGFLIFLAFGILSALSFAHYLFKFSHLPSAEVFSKLFAALVAYCAYSLFEKAILSEITFMVIFFWLILGYAMAYKDHRESNYKLL